MGQSFHVRASARGSAGVTQLLASGARPVFVAPAGDRPESWDARKVWAELQEMPVANSMRL